MAKTQIRCCLVFLNFLFVLAGLTGLALGGLMLRYPASVAGLPIFTTFGQKRTIQRAEPLLGPVLAYMGSICVLVSLCGCVGSLFNVRKLLVLYSLMLLLVMTTQMFCVFYMIASDGISKTFLERGLEGLMQNYNETEDAEGNFTSTLGRIFRAFQCCGIANSSDFDGTKFDWVRDEGRRLSNKESSLPLACCRNVTGLWTDFNSHLIWRCLTMPSAYNAYLKGCLSVIQGLLHKYNDHLIIIVTASGILEVLLLFMAAYQCLQENLHKIYEQAHVRESYEGRPAAAAPPTLPRPGAGPNPVGGESTTKPRSPLQPPSQGLPVAHAPVSSLPSGSRTSLHPPSSSGMSSAGAGDVFVVKQGSDDAEALSAPRAGSPPVGDPAAKKTTTKRSEQEVSPPGGGGESDDFLTWLTTDSPTVGISKASSFQSLEEFGFAYGSVAATESEKQLDNTPGSKTQLDNTPGSKTKLDSTPVSKMQFDNTPGSKTKLDKAHASKMPLNNTPGSKTALDNTPVSKTPFDNTPGSKTKPNIAPGSKTQLDNTPGSNTKLVKAHASKTPLNNTPGSKTALDSTPGSKTQLDRTPASKTQLDSTPGSKTQLDSTPGSKTALDGKPRSKTPLDNTPGSKTALDGKPRSKTPLDNTPESKTQPNIAPGSKTQLDNM